MDEKNEENLGKWFSTYGLITAERLLGKDQIKLPAQELVAAIKSAHCFYHKLLEIPLKNILNGIVLQQASDYHLYAQKLFVDYLLSGETTKDAAAQGASTREALEKERKALVVLGEQFYKLQLQHGSLIARSQNVIMNTAKDWNEATETAITHINILLKNANIERKKSLIRLGIIHAFVHGDFVTDGTSIDSFVDLFNQTLNITLNNALREQINSCATELWEILLSFDPLTESFVQETKEIALQLKSFRTVFYQVILRVTDLINLLAEYRINPAQDIINREPLHFDKTIGD
jgi:hypothetical protein